MGKLLGTLQNSVTFSTKVSFLINYNKFDFETESETIPNPIDLLERIASLESSLITLKSECKQIEARRPALMRDVINLTVNNYRDMEEVGVSAIYIPYAFQKIGLL
jgi:hypothetical protein